MTVVGYAVEIKKNKLPKQDTTQVMLSQRWNRGGYNISFIAKFNK